MTQITIIDTGVSNIASVTNAFSRIGCQVESTKFPSEIQHASVLVLPGVGAFEEGINALQKYNLVDAIRGRVLEDNIPIIGICLGMQLLAEKSYEHGEHAGLGIIPGSVVGLKSESPGYRVPNIGWYDVVSNKESTMFGEKHNLETFYHVHSYHMNCTDPEDVAAYIEFDGQPVTVAIEKDNVFGMQFHPEKSQDNGLNLLSRIVGSMQTS